MSTGTIREQLREQVNVIPDDVVQEVADFLAFVLARRQHSNVYQDWNQTQWQNFALEQFFRETADDVEYTLDDAQEIYRP